MSSGEIQTPQTEIGYEATSVPKWTLLEKQRRQGRKEKEGGWDRDRKNKRKTLLTTSYWKKTKNKNPELSRSLDHELSSTDGLVCSGQRQVNCSNFSKNPIKRKIGSCSASIELLCTYQGCQVCPSFVSSIFLGLFLLGRRLTAFLSFCHFQAFF